MKDPNLFVQKKVIMPLNVNKLQKYVSTKSMHYMFYNDVSSFKLRSAYYEFYAQLKKKNFNMNPI